MTELTQRKVGPSPSPSPPLSNDGKGVRVSEFDTRPVCANEAPRRYVQQGEQLVPTAQGRARTAGCFTLSGLSRELQEMFLPAGYPDSVSEDYLSFQFWDTLQAMCSYLRGVLATQSVLQSVGVGDDKATPLAAALQWVLRDGSGMIGGLTFAYFVGPKFDVNVKRWRLFADVINDVGLTLDMVAPYFPNLVTEVLCVSSVCKTMCGVAAGATRSSLMTHFAKRDNMADCAAKEGSQETAVKLFGLMFGMYFANAVNSSPRAVWVAFLVLTVVHVYANYNAVSCLCIPTVNCSRGLILVQRFLKAGNNSGKENVADHHGRYAVRSVNEEEPIFKDPVLPVTSHLIMGSELHQAIPTSADFDRLLQLYREEAYLLTVVGDKVHVMFQAEAQPKDELRAFFQAVLVLEALASVSPTASPPIEDGMQHQPLLESTHRKMLSDFPLFLQVLKNSGWRTHMFLLNTSTWRIKLSGRTAFSLRSLMESPDLCLLIKRGDVMRLRSALERHPALVQQYRWSGVTGLHRAVSEGNFEIVQLLLDHGADVNQRSTWGWYSPLHLACKTGSEEMIWLLLNHGAKWSLTDKAKKTPLQWAVRAGKASVAYRVDQQLKQLHAKAKLQAREQQPNKSQVTFAKLCG